MSRLNTAKVDSEIKRMNAALSAVGNKYNMQRRGTGAMQGLDLFYNEFPNLLFHTVTIGNLRHIMDTAKDRTHSLLMEYVLENAATLQHLGIVTRKNGGQP